MDPGNHIFVLRNMYDYVNVIEISLICMNTTYLKSLQKKQDLEKIQAEIQNSCSEMKKENTII